MQSLILLLAVVAILGVAVIAYAKRKRKQAMDPKKKLTSTEFFVPFYSRRKILLREVHNTSVELRHVERRIKNNYENMLTPEGGMNAELVELLRQRENLGSELSDKRKVLAKLDAHIERLQSDLKIGQKRDTSPCS